MTDTTHGGMTALTPQQLRDLANLDALDYRFRMNDVRAALRAAADQLEAVRAWLAGQDSAEWDSVDLDALDAIITADTAPQDGRDD